MGDSTGAATRTALLIGVGDAPATAHVLPSLEPTVAADLRVLKAALVGSGYTEVAVLQDGSRSEIAERITTASRRAEPGGTLLVYFTGHGVRIGDTDYLVPSDARGPLEDSGEADWDQPYILDSLLDADISRYLRDCRAGTVLWIMDACRSAEAEGEAVFGSRITQGPPGSGFVVMTGCGPGERSGFTPDGSLFTSALARAFDPLSESTTVEEVFGAARRLTRESSLSRLGHAQLPQIYYGNDREQETRTAVVADGRRLLGAWSEAVRAPGLWALAADAEDEEVKAFQESLTAFVASVARQVDRAQKRLPDPWADDDFPVRLLRDRLPQLVSKEARLSVLEVAALVAAVFAHEAAWAGRLSRAEELDPHFAHHDPAADEPRRHYELILEQYPQVADKIRRYRRWNGVEPESEATVLWLVHRWIAERFETEEQAVPAALGDEAAAALLGDGTANGKSSGGRAEELSGALRAIAAGLSLGHLAEQGQVSCPDRHVVRGKARPLRVRPLTALVRLAGLLALDSRTLPDVLSEHLAVSDSVLPREVLSVLEHAHLDADDRDGPVRELQLDVVCPHPAIHAALTAVVEEADELVQLLAAEERRLPAAEAALLGGLPSRVTGSRLRPAEEAGRRAYDVPLLRFSLAQTEVRRLLMGEQLYGGRHDAALRELYQNAMDACRYRAMRERYLGACGRSAGTWAGSIRITTGEDERGRYVECLDNGVGMTVEQLKGTFTRAGRRFEQSGEFRREQAAWLRQDSTLRLYPNSRFGIGVFSYFMLADEMTITTRPVGTDGRPAAEAIRVNIAGSGSLFRIRQAEAGAAAALAEGGTAVRLYLKPDLMTGDACVDALRSVVYLSEFRLEVRGDSGAARVWEPGVLAEGRGQRAIEAGTAVEAVPGTLWWVQGNGAILCDGIAADRFPLGYVLNLTGPHAGRLSVNREKLESYDLVWRAEQWRLGASALADWKALTADWLWALEAQNLPVARVIAEEWAGRGVLVRRRIGGLVDLDGTGWFPPDGEVVSPRPKDTRQRVDPAVGPWRAAVHDLRWAVPELATPRSLEGYPVPEPGWARLAKEEARDWRDVVLAARQQGRTVAQMLRALRGLRVAHPELAGPAVRTGDLDWVPDRLDRMVADLLLWPDGKDHRLSSDLDGYRHGPQDHRGLVRVSATGRRSLGELAERFARYAPFLERPLAEPPAAARDHVCGEQEVSVLYVIDDKGRIDHPTAGPWDLVAHAERTGLEPEEARRVLAGLAWLGWTVPSREETAAWSALEPDLRSVLSQYLLVDAAGQVEFPWAATLGLAARWETTVRKAEKIIAKVAPALGAVHRRRYASGAGARGFVPDPETADTALWLHEDGVRLEDGVSLRDLAFSRRYAMSWEERAAVVDDLRAAGVDIPDAAALLAEWDELPVPSRYAFSGLDPGFDGANYPVPPAPAVLFTGSAHLRQTLGYLWDLAGEETGRLGLPGLAPPELPDRLRDFRPTWDERWALADQADDEEFDEWFETPSWTRLDAARLIHYARKKRIGAREAFRLLEGFRAIGALVPELSPAEVAELPETVPDPWDVAALDPKHRVSPRGAPLVPLDLVSIACRLGEPLDRAWQRIEPYRALEERPTLFEDVPPVQPLWQDLAILSVGLDGLLPALTGPVTPERLAFAAEGVGETPAWVRDRLALYAELFGLDLPSAPTTEPDAEQERP
ncbi:caspase family protein [Kitasatospora sp. MBT66]|uniref:caspase family protein n=1 Tax=Kitasatospora sp. MBT66 TaxID=1444769 RepID=UPI00068B6A1B|nr:caspase family protein [Kitasatospora sp. MBT66]